MGDTDSEDYDTDEMNEAYEEAWAGLRDGTVVWKNSDGTFRCPYSPSRKKRDYKHSEIYQHAVGVAKGSRGPVIAGKHCALSEYLAAMSQPQAQRVSYWQQDIPPRVDSEDEDKRVCPWMGILQNIDIQTESPDENFRIGAWAADIKEKLKAFNPESVKVLHDIGTKIRFSPRYHVVAVIKFQNSMAGFKDAEAFENSFHCKGRGRRHFENDYPNGCDTYLYGWMATKKDVEGSNKLISDHLKSNGGLKSLIDIVRELEVTSQQQLQSLKELVIKKEDALQAIHRENWSLVNKLDNVMIMSGILEREQALKREKQRKELEAVQLVVSFKAEEHEENNPTGSSDSANKPFSTEGEELEVTLANLSCGTPRSWAP